MENSLDIKFSSDHIYVRTTARYAMTLAVDILRYIDLKPEYSAKNTGWKDSYGIKVCERIPIESDNLLVELETDGEELEIHLVSGNQEYFSNFINLISDYLNEKSPNQALKKDTDNNSAS